MALGIGEHDYLSIGAVSLAPTAQDVRVVDGETRYRIGADAEPNESGILVSVKTHVNS